MKKTLIIAILTSTALAAAPAFAQTVAPPADNPSVQAPIKADKATEDEIIVTARRRKERLQDTPVAITAISGDQLARRGQTNISEVATSVPNMTFSATASNSGSSDAAVVFIRGVGQSDFYPQIDPGVGIYLDGVYVARSTGSVLDTIDVKQVEVLRGPQGTLFGKNTIGGAVLVTSKLPSSELGGEVSVTTGRYNRVDARGVLNLPLTDNLAIRVSGATLNRDGYVKSLYDGSEYGNQSSLSSRLIALWQPTTDFTANFSLDWTRKREESAGTTLLLVDTGTFDGGGNLVSGVAGFVNNTYNTAFGAPVFDSRWITHNPYTNNSTKAEDGSDLDVWGASLTLNWDHLVPWASLKSITAYRTSDSFSRLDDDATPATIISTDTTINQKQFSQEFQLSGSAINNKLKWLVGAFYMNERVNFLAPVDIAFVSIDNSAKLHTNSYAVFSQVTLNITDHLSITPGLRYSKDDKSNDARIIVIGPPNPNFLRPPIGTVILDGLATASFHKATPALSVAYKWTNDFLTYASYSVGYKSGGFSQRIVFPRQSTPSFGPETVKSYEIGAKFTSVDRRVRINAAAFDANYTDMQVVVFHQIEPLNQNAGDARIKGLETEVFLKPVDILTLSGGVGYTDAKYTTIRDANSLLTLDTRLAYVSKWTGSASADLLVPVDSLGGDVRARLDWSYRSSAYLDALNSPGTFQPAFSLFNASVGYAPHGGWDFQLGVTNLTNRAYKIAAKSDLPTASFANAVYGRPREWSFRVRKTF